MTAAPHPALGSTSPHFAGLRRRLGGLWGREGGVLLLLVGVFLLAYFLPLESPRLQAALGEALAMTQEYARAHVLLCLVPALFIAGGIGALVESGAVMRYLGPDARRSTAYGVASVSGGLLAVCSCTVLPLFAGIWKRGAGLGPAITFLYAGPAINVLAVILTARVLGVELGVVRAVAAVLFSVVLGLLMALLFRGDEVERSARRPANADDDARPVGPAAALLGALVGVLVFANWAAPQGDVQGWAGVWSVRWYVASAFGLALAAALVRWFAVPVTEVALAVMAVAVAAFLSPGQPMIPFAVAVAALALIQGSGHEELLEWRIQTWTFTKQILPLLFLGVLVAGFALGRPGHEALVPSAWVARMVGDNGVAANLFAAAAGALMYFATLTEVPILQGLMGGGMASGPALALLLAGPALSLPNLIVIRSVLGTKKTLAFAGLVVLLSAAAGGAYGALAEVWS